METDIHSSVAGATWEEIWKSKVQAELQGVITYFASLDDLIKMKKAAGRGKDIDDLRYLNEIKRQMKLKEKKVKA